MDRTEYKSAIWFSIFVLGVSPGIVCVWERERALELVWQGAGWGPAALSATPPYELTYTHSGRQRGRMNERWMNGIVCMALLPVRPGFPRTHGHAHTLPGVCLHDHMVHVCCQLRSLSVVHLFVVVVFTFICNQCLFFCLDRNGLFLYVWWALCFCCVFIFCSNRLWRFVRLAPYYCYVSFSGSD